MSYKVSFFIARRYLFAWRKRNAINLITGISILGITVSTAALVILISAFNGIEFMIDKMYSDYDSDIIITSSVNKTFLESQIDYEFINSTKEIESHSKLIEEFVVLKNDKIWINAKVVGVESSFLKMSNINKHLLLPGNNYKPDLLDFSFIGGGLMQKLQLSSDNTGNWQSILCYAPKRDLKIRVGKNPFKIMRFNVFSGINFNREVNEEVLLLPINKVKELLKYQNELSAFCINIKEGVEPMKIKKVLQNKFGDQFHVKTRKEKNELIFKTSKSEKLIVILILIFVFVLSLFNLVSSITMIFAEKTSNLKVITGMGLSKNKVISLFFFVGVLISLIGVVLGLMFGYGVCFLQKSQSLLMMPGTSEPFPIILKIMDAFFIISTVVFLTISFSLLTVRFLIRRRFEGGLLKNTKFQ